MNAVQSAGWEEWSAGVFSAIGATAIGATAIGATAIGATVIRSWFRELSDKSLPCEHDCALLICLVSVFAIILGVVFWGDQITLELMVGGAMVMGGVTIITFRANQRRAVEGIDGA